MAGNPIRAGAAVLVGGAHDRPTEPHHRHQGMRGQPTHKQKVKHKGLKPVELHGGARKSAVGRDTIHSSSKGIKLPGKKEPSGIQKATKGAMRFGDQGRGR